jgi:cystathionine beta-lyase/cystathionine gamma-synthase
MISLEVKGGREEALRFMQATTIPILAGSLGGVETLLSRSAATTHSHFSPEERKSVGVSDSLIRLSVGLENTEELIDDLLNALGS